MTGSSQLERQRLDALRALKILGTASEAHLDSVCLIAASLFDVPIALVTLVDDKIVWLKSAFGTETRSVPREHAFCSDTILSMSGSALVVPDLAADERYRDGALVGGRPNARFYAGVPIALNSGLNIGTVSLIDTVPRPDFGTRQIEELSALARIVETHFRLHEARITSEREEQRYRLLAENTTDVIIGSDLDTVRRYISPASRAVLGYEPSELIGTVPADFVHPDDSRSFVGVLDDLVEERADNVRTCQRYRHKDGRWIWIDSSISLVRDPATGKAAGLVASLRDVSDRRAMEEALRVSEERLALAIEGGNDGLWDWNVVTGEVNGTDHWAGLLGYAAGEIERTMISWRTLTHDEDKERSYQALIAHFKGLTPRFECEYRVRTKAGVYVWTLARGKVVARDETGKALRMVGTHTNITARKESEHRIAHMATHDALTGLPNRVLFRKRLDQQIESAETQGDMFAVLAFDLDHFKGINDTLGHPAGDLFLQTVAERLKGVTREGDTVARLGGDEFAIVLGRVDHPQDAATAARRAIEAMDAPIVIDGHARSIGISVGVALCPADGRDADQLFKSADIALYQAKGAGRNTYRFYESGMDVVVANRNRLETELRDAVKRGSFVLHYQPVVSIATGTVECFEALLRWDHPVRGLIWPGEFISVAEETGLIVAMGDWALREACSEAATWPDHVRVAVNVSAVQFQRPGLEQSVLLALASSGLAADRLELEITESVLMQDADQVIACLHRLRGLGVRIALDDFGTGYSSLSYLRQFPFNKIKIDRAFVAEIANPDTAAIVRAVVGLGARAGASITAEGVETEDQLHRVTELGCTEVQGYFFSAPLPADEARAMIDCLGIPQAA